MKPSQYPSHCLANTLFSLSPHTPQGLLVRKPCAWATGSQTSKPSHPCPSRYGAALRWDRWNQRSDGTHFWGPGGALWRRSEIGGECDRRALNTGSSPTALLGLSGISWHQVVPLAGAVWETLGT